MGILSQLEELIKNGYSKEDIVLLVTMAPDLFKVSKDQIEVYFEAIALLQNYKDINAKLSGMESTALNKKLLEEINKVEKKDRPVLSEKLDIELDDIVKENKTRNTPEVESSKFNLDPYSFDSFSDDSDSLSKFFPDMSKDEENNKKHI